MCGPLGVGAPRGKAERWVNPFECGKTLLNEANLRHSHLVQAAKHRHDGIMKRLSLLVAGTATLGLGAFSAMPAHANPGDEQGQVRKEMRAGTVRPLREIEQRVLPMMPGMQYLGPEYDPTAMAYRLKFIQNGRVVFVDVDARSGQIISRH